MVSILYLRCMNLISALDKDLYFCSDIATIVHDMALDKVNTKYVKVTALQLHYQSHLDRITNRVNNFIMSQIKTMCNILMSSQWLSDELKQLDRKNN